MDTTATLTPATIGHAQAPVGSTVILTYGNGETLHGLVVDHEIRPYPNRDGSTTMTVYVLADFGGVDLGAIPLCDGLLPGHVRVSPL